MSKKLTNAKKHSHSSITSIEKNESRPLIDKDKSKIKFALAFRCKMETKFNFNSFTPENIKEFQNFLDKVSNMSISEVDKLYKRLPDKADKYSEEKIQVHHYEISGKFRIHGIWESSIFYVLRLDPRHKFHT